MYRRREFVVIGMIVVAAMLLLTNLALSDTGKPVMACQGLMDMTKFFQPGATITSAKVIPAGEGLPEHCRVEGWRWPDDGFLIKLDFAPMCSANIEYIRELPLVEGQVTSLGFLLHILHAS